jgi:hypothetical protein
MAAKMEIDRRESVRKLAQAHDVLARTVHGALSITWSSKKSAKVGGQTVFIWDEEGAIQDVQGGRSDGGRASLTVLDNILTLSEAAGGEERAGRPHSHSGGLMEALGWGYEQ